MNHVLCHQESCPHPLTGTRAQDNERAKECRYANKAVAAYKERAAENLRARLDADDDLPTSRRLLRQA